MRGHGTAAAAHGNKRAVAALALQRAEALEALCGRTPPALVAAVDVTSRFGLRTGEAGTGVDRSVRPERVGMAAMNLARSHVHAVGRGEPALPRLRAQERHLVVHEVARVADARAFR